jgi:hypothetical protein
MNQSGTTHTHVATRVTVKLLSDSGMDAEASVSMSLAALSTTTLRVPGMLSAGLKSVGKACPICDRESAGRTLPSEEPIQAAVNCLCSEDGGVPTSVVMSSIPLMDCRTVCIMPL